MFTARRQNQCKLPNSKKVKNNQMKTNGVKTIFNIKL